MRQQRPKFKGTANHKGGKVLAECASEAMTTDHLFGGQADCLNREFSAAHVEEVFKVGPEEVNDEDIVETFLSEVMHLRDTGYSKEQSP